jgi:hypothetical protein
VFNKNVFIDCLSLFLITNCIIDLSKSPAENPIFIAVSILSPVRTQIIIPVDLKSLIVSETPSYNLSSIAELPTSFKFYSILTQT